MYVWLLWHSVIQRIACIHCAFNESSGNFKYHGSACLMAYSMKHCLFVCVKYLQKTVQIILLQFLY